ncbi:hypothetical protein VTJ83DRAFT_2939 [Remersonia thermophila]|uniref:NYN domain-containing protein n=1 Tax=Remersonia thermophila TaxID=72144 RepID=A0ABR4DCM0_9PEZI
MASTYFGRAQRGDRRLGDDLDLLAKWARKFLCASDGPSYHLTQLSPQDLQKLFCGPPTEFRLVENPDHTVELEPLQTFVQHIDPDLVGLLLSPGYARSTARHRELLGVLTGSHHHVETAAHRAFDEALQNGADPTAADRYSMEVAKAQFDEIAAAVRERWKAEQDDRLRACWSCPTEPYADPHDSFPVGPLMPEAPIYTSYWHAASTIDTPFDDARTVCGYDTPGCHTHKMASHRLSKTPSPHGSETSVASGKWSHPTFSSESVSDAESDGGGFGDAEGGVSLLPADLAETLGFRPPSNAPTPTPSTPSAFGAWGVGAGAGAGAGPGPAAHLGNGLLAAISAMRAKVDSILDDPHIHLAHHPADPADPAGVFPAAISQPPSPAPAVVPCSRPATPGSSAAKGQAAAKPSPGPFSATPEKKVPFRETTHKPWMGFTCYDVPRHALGPDQLVPKYWTTKAGKERYLRHKVGDLKLDDAKVRSDRHLGFIARNPVHIFVDLSNIIIGFYDSMKESRGIPVTKRVLAPPFSFKNFDTILTRDRNVAKRVVAGSLSSSYNKRWPSYMLQAEELEYEMNILERVPKPAAGSPARKRRGKAAASDASGTDTSGEDNGGRNVVMKQGEQGVDELLHLKILQSAMDAREPATMVLATGDAASAQYSDGFKKNIERVLSRGWNIELYGWSRNISAAWREPDFLKKWHSQFKIFELDAFCEELYDMYVEAVAP